MNFQIVTVAVTLLSGSLFASATGLSHASRLVRRDQDPNFSGTFIMYDNVDYSNGPLAVYYPNGTVAYRFDQWHRQVQFSTSTLTPVVEGGHHQTPVITLQSSNDVCTMKSEYSETDSSRGSHLSYHIDPRGVKSDRWNFSFVNPKGEQLSYYYHRETLSKGGKVYESREKRPLRFVARLQDQTRWESWLHPGTRGTPTFTLYYDESTGLRDELVTLMALVLNRVENCGL